MTPERFQTITSRYGSLKLAIVGDFCLDRYFEIDPARSEISIETGLEVHNIVNVRCQPGAAGTILNNLVALGIPKIFAVGFSGEDGEGWELRRALQRRAGVDTGHFLETGLRRTFTYTKPLVMEPGRAPVELNRLDIKNWTATPEPVQEALCEAFAAVASQVDAMIIMDQVDLAETGVVTRRLLEAVGRHAAVHPDFLIVADSRRGLGDFPSVTFKMNAAELATMAGLASPLSLDEARVQAGALARSRGRMVFVSLAERGILGALPDGTVHHVPALPVRGEIDIVGAGDAVTANLTAALAAGATVEEALELAMTAASIVIHQLGTTGTASVPQLAAHLPARA